MKTKMLLVALFAMTAFCVNAQTENSDYSNYLNDALKKLEAGDCKGAQTYYNIYKELSGKSVSSVETMLNECNRDRAYTVGETMMVDTLAYTVAYIRDGGKHGLAIRNIGWKCIDCSSDGYNKTEYIKRRGIPTIEELKLIYENRDILRLYDIYWSCTVSSSSTYYYKTYNFSTRNISTKDYRDSYAIILLIHRF